MRSVIGAPTELVFDLVQSPKARKADRLAFAKSGDYVGGLISGNSLSEVIHQCGTRTWSGIVLATPTWRASREWGRKLVYSDSALANANRRAVDQLVKFRSRREH